MRYAILIYDEETANPSPNPPDPEVWAQVTKAYDAYTTMLRDAGLYLGGEALQPVTTATTVRIKDGETLTTDGPFAETKEILAGFYLIDAGSLEEALEVASNIPPARIGSIEVRPIRELQP